MSGRLFVVSGPSGAGKGTLCKELLKRCPSIQLSVSCATRAARPGETDAVHYYFISEEEFLRRRNQDDFLECAQINGGYWYGTPKSIVLRKLREGADVLLEIENNGAQQVIEKYPDTVSIFILPPSRETLIRRLVDRKTEDLAKLTARIRKVPSELDAARHYTYLVLNDSVESAVDRLEQIFCGEGYTNEAQGDILDELTRQFADMDECLHVLTEYYNKTRL